MLAISDFEKGDILLGIEVIGEMLEAIPELVGDSKDMQPDINRLENFVLNMMKNPTATAK